MRFPYRPGSALQRVHASLNLDFIVTLRQLTSASYLVGLTGIPVYWHFARMVADLQIYWTGHAQKGIAAAV